jgi:hypothetical protein
MNVPHFTVILVLGQVATIPMKAACSATPVPEKETVNTPVGAAVTRVQPPVPKFSVSVVPTEDFEQAVFLFIFFYFKQTIIAHLRNL